MMTRTALLATCMTLLLSLITAQNVYKDASASIEDRVEDLLSQMTLKEKVAQMIMDAENAEEFAPNIGSYLIGASDPPEGNTPQAWRQRMNELHAISANNRLGIPLFIGTDAVHGQNIISGATIFPHNIGLGATGNPSLIKKVAQATAEEMLTSGIEFTFAPTIAVARTMTWGRTYEAYSEDTDVVRSYVKSFIQGMQGTSYPWQAVATAKHWVGDGATDGGEDAGDATIDEDDLMNIHGAPYIDAIDADVGVIMISFSSINGKQLHGDQYLIEDVLKNNMGFDGFVLSDWEGYLRNEEDIFADSVRIAVNAGIDMLMAPFQAYVVMESITNATTAGTITEERINDAARRILRVKFKAGLFEKKVDPINVNTFQPLGTDEHRAIARQAVRESMVLLKNDNAVLPVSKNAKIFLAGKSADNIQNQCGGWTMSWQGTSDEARHAIVGGTTILDGLEKVGTGSVTFSQDGTGVDASKHSVAIIVVGELPYAEGEGDSNDLSLDSVDQATIDNVKASGVPIVLVIISGRPMIITDIIPDVDAVVAAWLPGTEGDGVAEVLFGESDFSGKLSYSWPANMGQVLNGFVGDNPNVLFELGYGLSFDDSGDTTLTNSTATAPTKNVTAPPTATPDETIQPSGSKTDAPTPMPSSLPDTELPTTVEPDTELPTTVEQTIAPTNEMTQEPTSEPTSKSVSSDAESPSDPEDLVLGGVTSSSVTVSWSASSDNIDVAQYNVYSGNKLLGTSDTTSFTATGLSPNNEYTITVVAVDDAGNESNASESLTVTTHVLVDDFNDGDNEAEDDWGTWNAYSAGDGSASLSFKLAGFTGFGARLSYKVDSGTEGVSNMYLDFDEGNPIDLTQQEITGVQFKMRTGESDEAFVIQLGTPLAEYNWIFYNYKLEPTTSWSTVTIHFQDFTADEEAPYSLLQALQNAASLVWETKESGQTGWLAIDDVEFMTEASSPLPSKAVSDTNETDENGSDANDTSSSGTTASFVGYFAMVSFGSLVLLLL